MSSNPVIVIPIFKKFENLLSYEKVSLKQCFKILANYPIVFFGPNGLDFETYVNFAKQNGISVGIKEFSPDYFSDVPSYSKLMLSLNFYESFREYSHMLIYQTDAYAFRDELRQWCSKGFDYIGAPWIEDKSGKHITGEITGIGNGGFCIRDILQCIRVLSSGKPFKSFKDLKSEYHGYSKFQLLLRYPKIYLRSLTGYKNTGYHYASRFWGSEDDFWCTSVLNSRYQFSIAPLAEAVKFSFEVAPAQLYEMNNCELPFGCHAFHKHQPDFWKKFINF